jgi:hypothetical protein
MARQEEEVQEDGHLENNPDSIRSSIDMMMASARNLALYEDQHIVEFEEFEEENS